MSVEDDDEIVGDIQYTWEESNSGTIDWVAISQSSASLPITSQFGGVYVRVKASYLDSNGINESVTSRAIFIYKEAQQIYPDDDPSISIFNDNDYEFGTQFNVSTDGHMLAFRFFKPPGETGVHVGKLWDSGGNLVHAQTAFNESDSGWQTIAIDRKIELNRGENYIVSVNMNTNYPAQPFHFNSAIVSGAITASAEIYNDTPHSYPSNSFNNNGYFIDLVFSPK